MLKSIKNRLKKAKKEAAAMPRSLDEIQKEYAEVSTRAGQAQYQAYVMQKDLEELNRRLLTLNQEAHERNRLDNEAKLEAKPKPEVKAE